ncbi:MAG: STN domain-containing protein, partial [Saprospiraceae bacterium]|nr:STN domain-containing protein [Saprospiraceae bacterium]
MSRRLIALCLMLLPGFVGLKAQDLAATGFFQYKEVPLGTVLSDISRDFQLRFSYSPDVVSLNQKISLDLRNASLELAMA